MDSLRSKSGLRKLSERSIFYCWKHDEACWKRRKTTFPRTDLGMKGMRVFLLFFESQATTRRLTLLAHFFWQFWFLKMSLFQEMLPDCFEIRVSRSNVLEESYQILQEAQIPAAFSHVFDIFWMCETLARVFHLFLFKFSWSCDALSAQAPRFEFLAPTLSVRYTGSLGLLAILPCICSEKRLFGTKNFWWWSLFARVCSTFHVASPLSFCKCRRRWSRWRRSHTGRGWQHFRLESVLASPGQVTSRDVIGVLCRTGSRLLGMPWLMVQAGTSTDADIARWKVWKVNKLKWSIVEHSKLTC